LRPSLWSQIVAEYAGLMGARMQEVVGGCAVDLEGRFEVVRTRESNLGNLVCDVFRDAIDADAVILNSGSLRWGVLWGAA
jgi:5'-nucleotidase